MVSVDQVPVWWVEAGIGHAVGGCGNGMIHTACGTLVFGDSSETQKDKPNRICRACRERLKEATLLEADNA